MTLYVCCRAWAGAHPFSESRRISPAVTKQDAPGTSYSLSLSCVRRCARACGSRSVAACVFNQHRPRSRVPRESLRRSGCVRACCISDRFASTVTCFVAGRPMNVLSRRGKAGSTSTSDILIWIHLAGPNLYGALLFPQRFPQNCLMTEQGFSRALVVLKTASVSPPSSTYFPWKRKVEFPERCGEEGTHGET